MITLWRIEKEKYIDSYLLGEGSRKIAGRWNQLGIPVVYTSDSMPLAAWEKYVNIRNVENDSIPMGHVKLVVLKIKAPESFIKVSFDKLDNKWKEHISKTQAIGSDWFKSKKSLLLKVPTTVLPRGTNYLINTSHPLVHKVYTEEIIPFKFDPRAF